MCDVDHAEEMNREYDVIDARVKTRALLAESLPVLEDLTHQLEQARTLLDRLEDAAEEI